LKTGLAASDTPLLQTHKTDCAAGSCRLAKLHMMRIVAYHLKVSLQETGRGSEMFSHVMIGTNDLEAAKSFYDKLLGTLGVPPGAVDRHRVFWRTKTGTFSVSKPINGEPACAANGGTIGFLAKSQDEADAWHAAGIANGATTCEEPPGIREGGVKLYLAYLRDPDGNKLCALYRLPKEDAAS
jgi:catechol 2,3-dioxygenase-like lactoylglutathione lyase family enzyme